MDAAAKTFSRVASNSLHPCLPSDLSRVRGALTAACPGEMSGCSAVPACRQELVNILAPLDSADDGQVGINGGRVRVNVTGHESGQLLLLVKCAFKHYAVFNKSDPVVFQTQGAVPLPILFTPTTACSSQPCANRAECSVTASGYNCTCTAGFSGQQCEINIDDCLSTSCLNGGVCFDLTQGFECECRPGFGGKSCQLSRRSAFLEMSGLATQAQLTDAIKISTAGMTATVAAMQYTVSGMMQISRSLFDASPAAIAQLEQGIMLGLNATTVVDAVRIIVSAKRRLLGAQAIRDADPNTVRRRTSDVLMASIRRLEKPRPSSLRRRRRLDVLGSNGEKDSDTEDRRKLPSARRQLQGQTESISFQVISSSANVVQALNTLPPTNLAAAINSAAAAAGQGLQGTVHANQVSTATQSVTTTATIDASMTTPAGQNVIATALSGLGSGLSASITSLGGNVTSIGPVTVLPEGQCTRGFTISGSNRTAESPCSGVIGEVCSFMCLNGALPMGLHVCGAGGAFSGGRCGGQRAVVCPASGRWEELRAPCEAALTVGTAWRQPFASLDLASLYPAQGWTQCAASVSLANAFCTSSAGGCHISALPLGVTTITLQSVDTSNPFVSSSCTLNVTVVDYEPPVINLNSCPSMVETKGMLAGLARDRSYKLVPSIEASDNSGVWNITTYVDGRIVALDEDWRLSLRHGKHTVSFVAMDTAGNLDACHAWVQVW
jgi:hypothetical protein